ncbi:MAG: geranylgeranyl reductase family protein [Haloferacaceae archaeon]
MYDLAVVGVGPAGARVARRFAADGYDVLALERGKVGRPLACSGHVSRDLWDYTPDGAREGLLQNEVYGARFHVGGPGSPAHRFYKREPVSNVIDRVGLDRTLAAAARDAGADVREGHTVTGMTERGDRVRLTVSADDDRAERTVDARLVAGCDGPTSRVRRAVGLPDPDELLHGVLGFDEDPDDDDFVDVHLTPPRFFAWRIPRGDAGVEYGLAAPPDDVVGERFESFVADYGADVARRCSGTIPVGPADRTVAGRTFLVGDAAGQTKPFTGGGILYGLAAADVAAERIDPADPSTLAAYERGWRAELGREIRLGAAIRRVYSLPAPVQRAGLSLLSGEIGVHMDRPSTLFSREHLGRMLGLG